MIVLVNRCLTTIQSHLTRWHSLAERDFNALLLLVNWTRMCLWLVLYIWLLFISLVVYYTLLKVCVSYIQSVTIVSLGYFHINLFHFFFFESTVCIQPSLTSWKKEKGSRSRSLGAYTARLVFWHNAKYVRARLTPYTTTTETCPRFTSLGNRWRN